MFILSFIIVIVYGVFDRELICAGLKNILSFKMQSSESILNPLTDLSPPHFSACSKSEPGFSTSYVVVLKMFNCLR